MQFLKTPFELITNTQITSNDKIVYMYLMSRYNKEKGCAYPSVEVMAEKLNLGTATVTRSIKKLAELKFLNIEKRKGVNGNYNIYKNFKYLMDNNNVEIANNTEDLNANKTKKATANATRKKNTAPVDSNGNLPVKGQIHVDSLKADSENVTLVKSYFPNVSMKDSKVIEGVSKDEIINALEDIKNAGQEAFNFAYVINRIEILKNKKTATETSKFGAKKPLKFNNFEPRQYNMSALEKQLLGWEPVTELSDITISNGADHNSVGIEGIYGMSNINIIEQLASL